MGLKAILPLIDLVFLTLGAILGTMTQMERVTALPVEVARVGSGAAVVQQGEFSVLNVTADGLTLDGRPAARHEVLDQVRGRRIVLRIQRDLPTEQPLSLLAELVRAGAEVSLEVHERPDNNENRPPSR